MATIITSHNGEGSACALLENAEAHYCEVLEIFEVYKACLKEESPGISEAEHKRILAEYRRATQTLFDERKKLEELRKRQKGIVHDYAIDFDEVRGEVGRLLDRLRAVGTADAVSGQSE